MANSRLPRFIMEVAPPQFVTVMRHRTRKMLDTISEEDRVGSNSDSLSPTSKSSPTSIPVGAMAAAAAASASSSSSATTVTVNSKVRGDWPNDQDSAETFVGLCLYVFGNVTDVMKGLVRLLHSVL
ncbi:hypothetical protein CRYUN_Cryun31cG0054300 [Craigia yunnanensis]